MSGLTAKFLKWLRNNWGVSLSAGGIFGLWLLVYWRMRQQEPIPFLNLKPLDYSEHGTLGDAFGALTALFAMLAFTFSVKASLDQTKELASQRELQRIATEAQQRSTLREEVADFQEFTALITTSYLEVEAVLKGLAEAEDESDFFALDRKAEVVLNRLLARITVLLTDEGLYERACRLHNASRELVEAFLAPNWSPTTRDELRAALDSTSHFLNDLEADFEEWVRKRMGHTRLEPTHLTRISPPQKPENPPEPEGPGG